MSAGQTIVSDDTNLQRLGIGILELSRTNDQAKLEELRAIIYKPDGLVSAATTLAVQRPAGYGTSSATNGGDPYYNAPHTYGSAGS